MNTTNLINDLPRHDTKTYNKRSLDRIKYVIIHHSATREGNPQQFAQYHVNHHGWPGIAYHYVIDKRGNVFQTQYLDTLSYHTQGNNSAGVGICCIGNYEVEEVPLEQIGTLIKLIEELKSVLPPFEIKGHRDFKKTSCPGEKLYLKIPYL